ncbi:hypothetical protein AJ80_08638 [Polytolypa hystricis UAMH7299]|uniref:UTP23 sensor motif region domain-containing protein n=1 Tax=Polytolypa hystricis (strain UAMH7299) TaxID=1447883 RepID=A0A2B7X521_POLH7|nr:hypothetical protein AJ80_08638 [Polytolypa hystricis UAMH7299]
MRAKRSKKYRKLMHQYETTFGFREPYQVLVDSHFLKQVHAFKMDLEPYLERTLQGKAKPYITKCSLAAVMESSPTSRPNVRPTQLPPPTILPLRYCSHNEENTPIDEASCLLSLLSPSAETKKNKEHYILATADPTPPTPLPTESTRGRDGQQWRKPAAGPPPPMPRYNLRRDARMIPGVPIIYVKRSVMVLEPMSGITEGVREGVERGKFKTGFVSTTTVTGKRKREVGTGGTGGSGGAGAGAGAGEESGAAAGASKKAKKAKGVNPLSVKKPKKRTKPSQSGDGDQAVESKSQKGGENEEDRDEDVADAGDAVAKTKRKRRHKSRKPEADQAETPAGPVEE